MDAEASVVAEAQHPVAGLEGAAADVELGPGERAALRTPVAGAVVEVVDVVASLGEHDDLLAGEGGGVPVGRDPVAEADGGRGGDDAVVGVVGGERLVDVASTEPGERVAFPGFLLASVLFEGDGGEPPGEAVEEPAGVDRAELLRVADEHDLRPSSRRGVEEHGELAGADHGGFVDDDHGAVVELEGPVGELEGPEREGVGRDRGLGLELRGGGRGQRRRR